MESNGLECTAWTGSAWRRRHGMTWRRWNDGAWPGATPQARQPHRGAVTCRSSLLSRTREGPLARVSRVIRKHACDRGLGNSPSERCGAV
jgi:hypothetical protein